jgi:hypothetical protein
LTITPIALANILVSNGAEASTACRQNEMPIQNSLFSGGETWLTAHARQDRLIAAGKVSSNAVPVPAELSVYERLASCR